MNKPALQDKQMSVIGPTMQQPKPGDYIVWGGEIGYVGDGWFADNTPAFVLVLQSNTYLTQREILVRVLVSSPPVPC